VEARAFAGYDGALPGEAVLIHQASSALYGGAQILDADDPPATYSSTEGVMWRPGETFVDPEGIEVEVLQRTADGFLVRIVSDQRGPVRSIGFDSGSREGFGTTGRWHVTQACVSSDGPALWYGIDSGCDYDTGGANSGHATLSSVDLSGLTPPYLFSFDYLLDLGTGDTASVSIHDPSTNSWVLLAAPAGAPHTLADTGGAWSRFAAELPLAEGAATTQIRFQLAADGADDAHLGFAVDDVTIDGCLADRSVVLAAQTVSGAGLFEACQTLETADGFDIAATGDVKLRAGDSVVLGDGFSVQAGGRLRVEIAEP
jgi:hypothetical protein